MARILLIIAALVIAGSAYLGFETKNKVDALQLDLRSTKDKLSKTIAELTQTKEKLAKTEEELTVAKATIEERDKEILDKKNQIDGLNEKLTKANAEVETLNAEVNKIKDEMTKLAASFDGIKIEEIAGKIRELSDAKTKLETELAEAKQVQETLNTRIKEKEDKLASSERQVLEYKTGFVRNGLTGTVLAYNSGWNFVVLSIGDKQGLKANTPMVLTRGGQMVAKVRVTSVEPNTAIADIVPGSTTRGRGVQPGDSVVFEGRPNN